MLHRSSLVRWATAPREEGWLRHQENLGEANLNAADGVVDDKHMTR